MIESKKDKRQKIRYKIRKRISGTARGDGGASSSMSCSMQIVRMCEGGIHACKGLTWTSTTVK
jgi:hypothetical protein